MKIIQPTFVTHLPKELVQFGTLLPDDRRSLRVLGDVISFPQLNSKRISHVPEGMMKLKSPKLKQ